MWNRYGHLAPVVLRLALGAVFLVHGYPKISHADLYALKFAAMGIPAPQLMVLLAGAIETVGGIALLLGFAVQMAAALLAAVMAVAILLVKLSKGFVGGYEFELVLLAGAVSLALSGAGKWKMPEG